MILITVTIILITVTAIPMISSAIKRDSSIHVFPVCTTSKKYRKFQFIIGWKPTAIRLIMLFVDLFIAQIIRTYNRFSHISHKKKIYTPKVVVKAVAPVTPVDETTKLSTVTQKAGNTFEVTLNKAVSSAAISDFSIVRDESNAIVAVNTAKLDAKDATKVTLTTYESLTDGKSYTVTYTAADEAKTQSSVQFTATDGTIDSLNLTPLEITAGKATTIKYQTIDKNGVVLSEKSIGAPATGIEVNTTNNDGYYTSAGNLYLTNVNDSATIVVSYHTYKYVDGKEDGVIEKTFTVKAIDSAAAASYDYTIAKSAPYNWATAKKNTMIAMEDTAYKAYIRIKDANGDALNSAQAMEYSVESSNNNVLIAAGTVDGAIELTPVAQGSAYLVISKDGKNVTSLPVTVGAKRVLTSVKVDNASVTIATDSAVDGITTDKIGQAKVTAKTYDQYGEEISGLTPDFTNTAKPAASNGLEVDIDKSTGVITTTAAPVGTYSYKTSYTDTYGNTKSGVFSVRVVAPGNKVSTIKLATVEAKDSSTAGYGTTRSVETTFNGGSKDSQEIHVYAVGIGNSGVIVSGSPLSTAVSVSAIKVTGSDGTVYAATGAGVKTVTSQAIDDTALQSALTAGDKNGALTIKVRNVASKNVRKYLPAGTYTVTYTVKDATKSTVATRTYSTQFTVKDEQPATTVKVVEPNIGSTDIKAAFENADYAVFSYDGVELTANGSSAIASGAVKAVIGATATNGTKATVKSVVVAIPVTVDGTAYTIDTVVPVNVTFTGTSSAFTNVKGSSELQMYS